ncbi:Prolyl 4-hydroxylase subunit alpha-2 [Nymphon striatum]|nr:Prolyl 4-hydroxylase subunit alpha-2 [Nymphon striatum]
MKVEDVSIRPKIQVIYDILEDKEIEAFFNFSKSEDTVLNYELTPFPMSLFKDGLMREPTKAVLRNALLTEKADVDPNALHVLDGEALLHKVRWSTSVTYREVCDLYVNHIKSKYGIGTIVFDGYMDGPSTKDHEHARRSINKRRCADVQCDLSTKSGNKVIKCDEDADTEIVRCALYVAETGRKVNVVADDTDVALLLLYHWSESMEEITFTSERSKATFNITSSLLKIPAQIKSYLLVLHAWTGCDTTSAIHSKGKNSLLRKLKTSQHLRSLMDILSDKNADQVEVGAAGIELFLYMYGGNQTLTKLRFWIGDEDSEIVSKVTKKLEFITGLKGSNVDLNAEAYQIATYPPGGRYVPHMDAFDNTMRKHPDDVNGTHICGDRIATAMIYLSEVAAGGNTVFPLTGVSIKPQKGAAVIWWNLDRKGDSDIFTRHGGCPVLLGSKWIANKWFCYNPQLQKLPCSKNADDYF